MEETAPGEAGRGAGGSAAGEEPSQEGRALGALILVAMLALFVSARAPVARSLEQRAAVSGVRSDRDVLARSVLAPELALVDAMRALPAGTPVELPYEVAVRVHHERAQRFWFGLLPRHPVRRGAAYAIRPAHEPRRPGAVVVARGDLFVLVRERGGP